MSQPDITAACRYALERLEHELAPTLFYHNVAHTRDDVVPAVERLAERAGVPTAELALLRTAAWFHDLGFVERRTDHERVSACIVIAVLPLFGYSSVQIDIIKRLIMATRMPQRPETLLEMLLADADLDSLGRPDFLATSMALRAELEAGGGNRWRLKPGIHASCNFCGNTATLRTWRASCVIWESSRTSSA